MTSSALNTKNAMSSQSTATTGLPPADPCRARHAAQVEDRDEGGARDHSEPLEPEDEAEPHPRILGRPSFDEFRLRLGDVERDPFHLRHHRDAEDDEPENLRRENVPCGDGEGSE